MRTQSEFKLERLLALPPMWTVVCILLAAGMFSGTARADVFGITLTPTGDLLGSGDPWHALGFVGTFTTDGICSVCTISESDGVITGGSGLLTLAIGMGGSLSYATGIPFGLGDYESFASEELMSGYATYDRTTNVFTASVANRGDEFITFSADGSYDAIMGGSVDEWGVFSVSGGPEPSVPEPSAWLFLLTILIFLSVAARRPKRLL